MLWCTTSVTHFLSAAPPICRLFERRWPAQGLTWPGSQGAPAEGGGALQGRAHPAARGWRARGRALPGVAAKRGGGESQRAAAHPLSHGGEDDKRPHHEVVSDTSVATDWLLALKARISKPSENTSVTRSRLRLDWSLRSQLQCVPILFTTTSRLRDQPTIDFSAGPVCIKMCVKWTQMQSFLEFWKCITTGAVYVQK